MKGNNLMNIYDELRNGLTAEELVANFTAQLNEAEARIKEEDAEKARLANEAEAKESKHADFVAAVDAFSKAVETHYSHLLDGEAMSEEDKDDLADIIIMLLDLEAMRGRTVKVKAKVEPKTKSANDVFAEFFKTLGL